MKIYNRKLKSEAIDKWVELFGTVHPKLLVKALDRVTREAVSMPTPGVLTKAIESAKAELCWRDMPLITCVPGKNAKGVPCVFWSDDPLTPAYRAVDCPEGRAFLAAFAQMAGKSVEQIEKYWDKWTGMAKDLSAGSGPTHA